MFPMCNERHLTCIASTTDACTDPHQGELMFAAPRIYHQRPVNTRFHVRLQLKTNRLHVPYVRPVVTLTNASGARL